MLFGKFVGAKNIIFSGSSCPEARRAVVTAKSLTEATMVCFALRTMAYRWRQITPNTANSQEQVLPYKWTGSTPRTDKVPNIQGVKL